jgi:hypothetical protein
MCANAQTEALRSDLMPVVNLVNHQPSAIERLFRKGYDTTHYSQSYTVRT